MRSCATSSAFTATRSAAATAASISLAEMRMPCFARSTRSNHDEYSARATSPRARTSAMIVATASSTSSDASRLAFSNATNLASKSAALASRNAGMAPKISSVRLGEGQSMAGAVAGLLARSDVAKLGFETFDFQPGDGAVGERQKNHSRRRVSILERHGQQVQPVARSQVPEAEMRDAEHAVE